MKTRVWAFFIAASLALHTLAAAQTTNAVLRAGEHEDFTRLVLSVPEGTSWRLDTVDTRVDLILDDAALAIDVSQTFERIPRTRLRAVEAMPTGVRLFLACPCPVRLVEGFSSQIILDILSAPLPDDAANATVGPRPRPRPQDWSPIALDPKSQNQIAMRAGTALAQAMRGAADLPGDPNLSLLGFIGTDEKPPPVTGLVAEAGSSDNAQGLTQAVANAISGAVSRDLLSADTRFAAPNEAAGTLGVASAAHLRLPDAERSLSDALAEPRCAQAASATIGDWSTLPALSPQDMDWGALYSPMDQIDTDVAKTFATHLIKLGFGTEARVILGLLPDADISGALLSLTYLVDLERPTTSAALLAVADCSDLDALWAFLAAPDEVLIQSGATDRIIRAIQSLSADMRSHLGPSVVQHLLRYDATEAAQLVQAALNRTLAAPAAGSTLSATRLILEMSPAATNLAQIELMDMPASDLLLLLDTAEKRDLGLPEQVLEQAAARQFEVRRSPAGQTLAEALARAFGRAGAFRRAFDIALSRDASLAPAIQDALLETLFQRLVAEANDSDFVTLVFEHMAWIESSASRPGRMDIAERLADLGFLQQANMLQSTDPVTPDLPSAVTAEAAGSVSQVSGASRSDGTEFNRNSERTAFPLAQGEPPVAPPSETALSAQAAPTVTTPSVNEDGLQPDAGPIATGLLAQSRESLREAANLRAQLLSLLDNDTVP